MSRRLPPSLFVLLAALTALALFAPVALAAGPSSSSASSTSEPYVALKGAPGPGPSRYDRVWVRKIGPSNAKRVLVLVPGLNGGSGNFRVIGRDLVKRVKDLQVWALDRRESAFEDQSGFLSSDPERAYDYYLGFRYHQVSAAEAPFVREWGLAVQLADLRRVVRAARDGGRRQVILGGHSAGASTAAAYAAWDFGGRPGYRDLTGIVLIDGGTGVGGKSLSVAKATREKQKIDTGSPFLDLFGAGIPSLNGVFAELVNLYGRAAPNAPSRLQEFAPLSAAGLAPRERVTNLGLVGSIFDAESSPSALALLHIHAGRLASGSDPHGWVGGEFTPLRRFVEIFRPVRGGKLAPGGAEWYWPRRLGLDLGGAGSLVRTKTSDYLGLRTWHGAQIDVPLYAFETGLTKGGVIAGARSLVRHSRIPRSTLVSDPRFAHLDPLAASPDRNTFLRTVVPFLKRLG
jgi:hypothetical protein